MPLTGASGFDVTRMIRSSLTFRSKPQPTPQYPQVVETTLSGLPRPTDILSSSAPVGQYATQAPHDSQRASSMVVSRPALIFAASPRCPTPHTKRPCTSAQARTQLVHRMHLLKSTHT